MDNLTHIGKRPTEAGPKKTKNIKTIEHTKKDEAQKKRHSAEKKMKDIRNDGAHSTALSYRVLQKRGSASETILRIKKNVS